jgi:thiol-disulfide isomerase/thioredoxin
MKKIFIVLSLIFALSACSMPNLSDENTKTKSTVINEQSKLKDFYGKPSIILFGGTYCPHCKKAIPDFEKTIYTPYKDKANIWVNVVDGKDGKKFDNNVIAQGFNPNLKYNDITGEDCKYVPSWLILDSNGKVVLSSCGNKKTMDDMENTLKGLL